MVTVLNKADTVVNKRNRSFLASTMVLRKILEIFFDFFFSIYIYQITGNSFNAVLYYRMARTSIGLMYCYLLAKYISAKNARWIFRLSFLTELFASFFVIVISPGNYWLIVAFVLLDTFSTCSYYATYEITLINSSRRHSLSSYNAGVGIIKNIVSISAPIIFGFITAESSFIVSTSVILIITVLAMVLSIFVKFDSINKEFRLKEFWSKVAKSKIMVSSYFVIMLGHIGGVYGVLNQLLPIMLVTLLGNEFGAGGFSSVATIGYIILLWVIRAKNKKGESKKFYVPFALITTLAAAALAIFVNTFTALIFYFTFYTLLCTVETEAVSMIYAIGNREGLTRYTREHFFIWNIFLAVGDLIGIAIAFVVCNYVREMEPLPITIVTLTSVSIVYATMLQAIEKKLKGM